MTQPTVEFQGPECALPRHNSQDVEHESRRPCQATSDSLQPSGPGRFGFRMGIVGIRCGRRCQPHRGPYPSAASPLALRLALAYTGGYLRLAQGTSPTGQRSCLCNVEPASVTVVRTECQYHSFGERLASPPSPGEGEGAVLRAAHCTTRALARCLPASSGQPYKATAMEDQGRADRMGVGIGPTWAYLGSTAWYLCDSGHPLWPPLTLSSEQREQGSLWGSLEHRV
ncbi:hypothetical protein TREES_T100014270 [Tupaia chinensis]|uniref:Uncharacterized protein n=1 Tax=Tupaia chinensis TaxID=246437 RepID=L9JIG2_TUPCH|nr:hypothetical protein TREES_T100014270 [Tupaia chinensis]